MDGLVANLFGRYKRIMRTTFLGVLLIATGLFYVQIRNQEQAERELLATRLQENANALNYLMKTSALNVDELRLRAETWYRLHPEPPPPSPLFRALTASPADGFFTLDTLPAPWETALVGNLTAPVRPLTPEFVHELEMALDLNRSFHAMGRLLPNAAWLYYTSKSAFINLHPWVRSPEFRFTPALLEKEFYLNGLPERNPQRSRFWTEAYVDEAGKGLMVTVAAPVYQHDTFRGTVAIDLTLDELNSFVRAGSGDAGTLFIVNDRDQLLAHPRLVTSRDSRVKSLAAALPEALAGNAAAIMRSAEGTLIHHEGWLVEALRLEQAPFRLVLVAPRDALLWRILHDQGLTVFGLLLGLAATLAVTTRTTLREFILPSQRLVDYIAEKLRGQSQGIPVVPEAWLPWFRTIRDVFGDHAKLLAIQNELDVARNMQQSILPTRFPDHAGVEVFARMLPAKEIGGDFYDFFWLAPGLLGVVVADVSGKGVPAALFMAVARTLIRSAALGSDGPGACMAAVNNYLAQDNDSAMFVTAFYGIIDVETGDFCYANAGHTLPCLVDAGGGVSELPGTGGIALGAIEEMHFAEHTLSLVPGATLLIYTDGVTEAFDPEEIAFTEQRLRAVLAGTQKLGVTAFVEHVVRAVNEFAAGAPQADDLTCLALRYAGPAAEERLPS